MKDKWSEMKVTQLCLTLCDPINYIVHGILQARILEWVAFLFSRRSSQPRDWTQVSHIAGGILYQLSHKRSPRILEWVAYPFSSGSYWPRNQTRVSCIASGFFTNWAIREALVSSKKQTKKKKKGEDKLLYHLQSQQETHTELIWTGWEGRVQSKDSCQRFEQVLR